MPFIVGKSKNPIVSAAFAGLRGKAPVCDSVQTEAPGKLAHPKGPKAKPGKGAPTKEERAWLDWITSYGCIACRIDGHPPRPSAPHHILRGGRRMGHLYSIPLCDPGHHQGGQPLGLVSRHPDKAPFEKKYGTELELLAKVQAAYAADKHKQK